MAFIEDIAQLKKAERVWARHAPLLGMAPDPQYFEERKAKALQDQRAKETFQQVLANIPNATPGSAAQIMAPLQGFPPTDPPGYMDPAPKLVAAAIRGVIWDRVKNELDIDTGLSLMNAWPDHWEFSTQAFFPGDSHLRQPSTLQPELLASCMSAIWTRRGEKPDDDFGQLLLSMAGSIASRHHIAYANGGMAFLDHVADCMVDPRNTDDEIIRLWEEVEAKTATKPDETAGLFCQLFAQLEERPALQDWGVGKIHQLIERLPEYSRTVALYDAITEGSSHPNPGTQQVFGMILRHMPVVPDVLDSDFGRFLQHTLERETAIPYFADLVLHGWKLPPWAAMAGESTLAALSQAIAQRRQLNEQVPQPQTMDTGLDLV